MTLLPEFRTQLHTAAHRRAHSRRHRIASRFSGNGQIMRVATTIPALLSVLVAVGITVVALATLSHRHHPPASGTAPASTRTELLQTVGVLRRPQTKADLLSTRPPGVGGAAPGIFRRATSPVCQGENRPLLPCSFTLDGPLVRTVMAGGGYRVAIFPTVVAHPIAGEQLGEGVVITLRGPGIYLAVSDLKPASVQAIRARGLLLSAYVDNGVNRGVILVPDGVAKVILDHFRLTAPIAALLDHLPQTTATVSDNVARFQLAGLTEQGLHINPAALGRYFYQGSGRGCQTSFAVYALPATAQMTWLNAASSAISTTTISLELYVGTHHPLPGTTAQNPSCSH
jgi:hypothetical protein